MKLIFNLLWQNRWLFYASLIFGCILAFAPADAAFQPSGNDKLLHAIGFFLIAHLCHLAHPDDAFIWQIIGLASFGAFVELVQAALPYRSFSVLDWLADLSGILVYYFIFATPLINFLRGKFLPD